MTVLRAYLFHLVDRDLFYILKLCSLFYLVEPSFALIGLKWTNLKLATLQRTPFFFPRLLIRPLFSVTPEADYTEGTHTLTPEPPGLAPPPAPPYRQLFSLKRPVLHT